MQNYVGSPVNPINSIKTEHILFQIEGNCFLNYEYNCKLFFYMYTFMAIVTI